jgi:hypothetical protein
LRQLKKFLLSFVLLISFSCDNPLGSPKELPSDFGAINETGSSETTTTYTVDQTDDDNTATGFGGGTHQGTTYMSGVLTLNATTNNAELDESWTPQWSSLVSYWTLDGSLGNVANASTLGDSVGVNTGTSGDGDATMSRVSGKLNQAIDFDGVDDYISIGTNASLNHADGFSVSVWVNADNADRNEAIVESYSTCGACTGWKLNKSSSSTGIYQFTVRIAGVESTSPSDFALSNQWTHLLGVREDDGTLRLYVNGVEVSSSGSQVGAITQTQPHYIGARSGATWFFDGTIDDFAIWDAALTADEVALIYSRQSAKYSGEMKSRIMDSQSTSSSWTNLDWITTLPFGKELPDGAGTANSESSEDYSGLYNDSLMDGLVGLWHFDESSLNTGGSGEDFLDSGGGRHLSESGTVEAGAIGILNNAAKFDGTDDYIDLGSNIFSTTDAFLPYTACLWANVPEDSTGVFLGQWPGGGDVLRLNGSKFEFSSSGSGGVIAESSSNIILHKWYHLCFSKDSSQNLILYIDGKEDDNGTHNSTWATGGVKIGGLNSSTGNLNSYIDEVAIWSRALDADEILQLYRRGANRIKYQVRTCTSSDCSDQDALTGDGWKGLGGNYLTYFSELYNNSSVTSSCTTPQACFASELSLDGDVQTTSPSLYFNQFGADGVSVDNNRYFQYRVIMESDDENTACSGGTTCMPEIESISIGPEHSYEE